MNRRTPMLRVAIAVGLLAWMFSCTFTVDLEPLTDEQCPPDQKACGEKCVSKRSPSTGCALPGCAPCSIPNASATCGPNGQCLIAACVEPYRNCDTELENGCEVNIQFSVVYCGSVSCDEQANQGCNPPNAQRGCSGGKCAIGSCNEGYLDCDGQVANGCEVNASSDRLHCGSCIAVCANGQKCANRKCV